MKQLFLFLGVSAFSLNAFAQQDTHHQHTGDQFGVSVFSNMHTLRPSERADAGMYEKLSALFPKWYIQTDQWTGGFYDLNGPAIAISGSSLEDKAMNLLKNQLAFLKLNVSEWFLKDTYKDNDGFTYLYYTQKVAGKSVAFSKMNFRFTPDGALTRVQMQAYGMPDKSVSPSVSESKALEIAKTEMGAALITNQTIDPNWEWFPIPSNKGYSLHPAYKFSLEGKVQESSSIPLNIFGYVDGITGELLYRDNETKDAIDLTIVGSIYTNGILNPTSVVGLPGVTGKIGTSTTLLANDTGLISSAAFSTPTTMSVSLQGQWSTVRSAPHSDAIPTFSKNITASGTSDSFKTSSPSSSRHINAYYHVNTVHDFMKKQYGTTFTAMDYSLTTNVDVTGTCNAFFTAMSGSSINFFPAGGGCVSFAEIRDIVYHEYGHAIASRMYGGMNNGGLNEGQADVWGMSITGDSILGRGTTIGSAGSLIRRYDVAPKVFPFDLVGQVHADGEIIAGAWWDYGRNVNSVDSMGKLFSKALITGKPDGPNGTEGKVYFDFLIDALISDDDDANLSNGTPNFNAIVDAFAKHGIYLLQDVTIAHSELNHQNTGAAIPVNATLTISNPTFFQSIDLVYRTSRGIGSTWTTVPMVDAGGFNFSASIPAQPQGTIVDYYFAVKDLLNNEGVFFPTNFYPVSVVAENRSNLYYQFGVGISAMKRFDFESPLGPDWSIGQASDNANSGNWIIANPVAAQNSGQTTQTGLDHTTIAGTGNCLVTGNAPSPFSNAYTASVKNGKTTVLSPIFDISVYTNPIVEFYRWFGNDRGRNPKKENWRVQMGTGSVFFLRDIDYTNQPDYQWRRRMFKPSELFATATKMQLIFTATESPVTGSSQNGLVEAAVDDIVIYEGKEGVSSIGERSTELANIYPNPSTDFVNIVLPQANFSSVSIRFYDLSGKLMSNVATTKGGTHYAINTKDMVPGQYMLVLEMDKTIQTHKVTVQGK